MSSNISLSSCLVVVVCITSFWLVLIHFEYLRILVLPNNLNIWFSQLWKFILGRYLKVRSLFSARIFKNMMNNYAWTLIIWWKRKIFIYFINCYWIKNLLSIVIQSKNILLCFISTKLTACMSSTWSAVLYLVCLFFSFFMQNWILRYTYKYFFQHVLKFSFYNLHFLKALRT